MLDQKEILSKLTLEEKCSLLSGADTFKTRKLDRVGIPQMWLSDGPNGVRKQAGAADHLGISPSVPATCFPTASAAASSWDTGLGETVGRALGEEAAAQDVAVLLGPGLNIKRSPLCGRNFEYFSEDPYLSGKMAASYVRGIQESGISACPKHFAVNSQELRRMASNSVVDERTLRELYLTGFEIVVKEAKPKTIMTSYNLINGEYANENKHLLVDILRKEWGYKGAVVTDWGGSNDHALGVKYGSTLEMPAPGGDSVRELLKAVQSGKITEEDINDRVKELLTLIDETGEAIAKAPDEFDIEEHHAAARKAANECAVLLKNDGSLLPIGKDKKVALIGDFAETSRYQGAGSSMVNATKLDTLKVELERTGINCIGFETGFERYGKPDDALKEMAGVLAKDADVVVVCLGLDEIQESEGKDRDGMRIKDNQIEVLAHVAKINPNVVVILYSGAAVETEWAVNCKSLVWAALGGQAGAGAMADILTGKVVPSGKLAETWPVKHDHTPAVNNFGGAEKDVEYREGLYVGYRYYESANVPVAFPFGFGLSYTTFEYSNIKAGDEGVSLKVKNTGKYPGAEVVEMYIEKKDSILPGPKKQLRGFTRVELAPGEEKEVKIAFDDYTFRFFNTASNKWEIEGGKYDVLIGASSEDIKGTVTLTRKGTMKEDPYKGMDLAHYRKADVQNLPDKEFEALLGHPAVKTKVKIDRNITLGELNHSRAPLGWIIWAVLTMLLNASLKRKQPDLNIMFQYNMPLRALAKMTNGMISMGMVDALVLEFKGFWIIGLVWLIIQFVINLVQNMALNKRLAQ